MIQRCVTDDDERRYAELQLYVMLRFDTKNCGAEFDSASLSPQHFWWFPGFLTHVKELTQELTMGEGVSSETLG